MSLLFFRLKLRLRRTWVKLCHALGFCPCGSRLNYTPSGRPICWCCDR